MKDYCVKHGDFVYPDKTASSHSYIFTEILNIFLPAFRFWSCVVWAIPYSKVLFKGKRYEDTISKPSYIQTDSSREVFVNGETKT